MWEGVQCEHGEEGEGVHDMGRMRVRSAYARTKRGDNEAQKVGDGLWGGRLPDEWEIAVVVVENS